MKKIIIFNGTSSLYGAERGLLNFIKALGGNYEITVVLPKAGFLKEKLKAVNRDVDIKIFSLPVLTACWSPVYWIKTALSSIVSVIYFSFYVIFKKIDIICTNSLLLSFPGVVAKITNKRHIWYLREFLSSGILNKIYGIFVKFFSTTVICQSEAIADKLFLKSKSNVIYEPLDTKNYKIYNYQSVRKEFKLPPSARIITIISRIHPLKGQYEFIEKIKDTLKISPDLFLIIIGDISCLSPKNILYKKKMEKVIKENRLNNVFFLGYRDDIDRILSMSDICVFPFLREEPLGIAVAEALAFGKKTFYPKSGGLKEVYKIFGSGEDFTIVGVLEAVSRLKSGRLSGTDKLCIPDALCFKTYKDKIVDIIE